MADVRVTTPLTFDGGLHREWDTDVAKNAAKRLLNWQPTPDGGLMARRKWIEGSEVGAPVTRKVRGISHLPVQAGLMTPARRQRNKRSKKGTGVTSIEESWWWATLDRSCLIAILSYSSKAVATSTINVTPPAGWTAVATVHSNDAPSTLSMRIYKIENAAERDGEEVFTFDQPVRRAQLEIMEWVGVATANAQDVLKTNTGYSARPDTDFSVATDDTVPKQVVIAAVAAVTNDRTIKPDDFPEGWYEFTDEYDPPFTSVGREDYWLNQTIGRKVITYSGTQRFYASYDATAEEDDAKSRWVAALVSFRARERSVVGDKDYYLVVNENDARTHGLFAIDLDQIDTGAWAAVGTLDARLGSVDERPLSMATGLGGVLIASTDIHASQASVRLGLFRWDGNYLVRLNGSPRSRVVAFHGERFYAGGTRDHPNRLYWSKLGDETTWEVETDYTDVGGDGEYILDARSTEFGLLIAKRDGLFLLHGPSGSPSLDRLDAGTAQAGRCIVPIPGGAMIAGRDHIWLWQGGSVKLLSRALDDWWQNPNRKYVYGAYVNNLVYFNGADEDTCVVFDVDAKHWWVDKTPVLFRTLYAWDSKQLLGGVENQADSFIFYKNHPGTDRARDPGHAEEFELLTQTYMFGSPSRPMTPKYLFIAYQKRNYQAGHPNIKITPIYDGVEQTPRYITESHVPTGNIRGNGDHRDRVDVGVKAQTAAHKVQFRIEYDATAANSTMIDIEAVEFVYDVEEMR